MQPADGVVIDAVDTRRHHWRGALIGVGVVIAAGVLLALAPQPAHADDGDPGLVGSLVHGVATTVTDAVEPVAAPLPDARELPVVGGLVGQTADSRPVGTATAPVAQLVDGLLGDAVGSLPVVGGLLGDAPGASITDPVGGVADGVLGAVAGAAHDADAVPADADTAPGAASSALWLGVAAGGVAVPLIHRADDLAVMVAAGVEGLLHGPVSAPGDITPTSAVTAGGPPIGLAAAVLGVGLLFLLARGRVRPAGFRAPPSPVFATDTSPD